MQHFETCPFLGLSHFPPQRPEGARKKPLTGFKANGDDGRTEKSNRGHRFARETSNDDDDTACEGPARGPHPAEPVFEHPQSLDPRLLPVWIRGLGRDISLRGRRILWAGLETGTGTLFTLRPAGWRGPRGRSCTAHPHVHPLAAPPALLRGQPKSHREPRERPWGAGRETGADSGAQAGRRTLHTNLGPPDASTQTQ